MEQPLLKPEVHIKARRIQVFTCYHNRRATVWNAATTHDLVWKWFWNVQKISISAKKDQQINTLRCGWSLRHCPVGSRVPANTETISGRKKWHLCLKQVNTLSVQNDIKKQSFGLPLYKTATPLCVPLRSTSAICTAFRLLGSRLVFIWMPILSIPVGVRVCVCLMSVRSGGQSEQSALMPLLHVCHSAWISWRQTQREGMTRQQLLF